MLGQGSAGSRHEDPRKVSAWSVLGQCLASDKCVLGQCLVKAVRGHDSAWSVLGQGSAWPRHENPIKASAWSVLGQGMKIGGNFVLGQCFVKAVLGQDMKILET